MITRAAENLESTLFFVVVLGFELWASHLLGRCLLLEPSTSPAAENLNSQKFSNSCVNKDLKMSWDLSSFSCVVEEGGANLPLVLDKDILQVFESFGNETFLQSNK
jgi:hypothetical protein